IFSRRRRLRSMSFRRQTNLDLWTAVVRLILWRLQGQNWHNWRRLNLDIGWRDVDEAGWIKAKGLAQSLQSPDPRFADGGLNRALRLHDRTDAADRCEGQGCFQSVLVLGISADARYGLDRGREVCIDVGTTSFNDRVAVLLELK